MKIRIGFVSNSSSSSFICDVCGEEYSSWDPELSDAEMVHCKNLHTICESHICLTTEEFNHVKDDSEDNKDYDDEWRYSFPMEGCPICSLKHIDPKEAYLALRHSLGLTDDGVKDAIKFYRLQTENKK